ncbi:hypothetical protein EON63_00745 [archaeon]|nr:MAG: hypothetical protein EON63_00745 [archaeon]
MVGQERQARAHLHLWHSKVSILSLVCVCVCVCVCVFVCAYACSYTHLHAHTRRYHNQSVLRMHVDTANTHVVSAIINVDQQVDKPWPLVILDHDG